MLAAESVRKPPCDVVSCGFRDAEGNDEGENRRACRDLLAAAGRLGSAQSAAAGEADRLRAQVASSLQNFEAAWRSADAERIGQLFAATGDLVIPTGSVFSGRPQIVDFYRQVFRGGYANSKASATLAAAKLLTPDIARARGSWRIERPGQGEGAAAAVEAGNWLLLLQRAKPEAPWLIVALIEQAP